MSGKRWFRAIVSPNGGSVEALFEIANFDARIFRVESGAVPVDPEEVDEEFAGRQEMYLTERFESVLANRADNNMPLSLDELNPYIVNSADELQEFADNWKFCRLLYVAKGSNFTDGAFDSHVAAHLCLQQLDLAREMRLLASESRYLGVERRYRLYMEALRIERDLPNDGLLSLGIVSEYAHPADAEWLLREHLAGRWNGVAGSGELNFDQREMPWIRDCDMGLMISELDLPSRSDLDAWETFIQERVKKRSDT